MASLSFKTPWFGGLRTEDDVLDDRQVVGEHEVLVHHADAGGDRIGRRLEVGLVPEHGDGALVGLVHAVQRLHQRRLARTVLADDGVDRARPDSQGDVVVGDDARERLADPDQFDRVAAVHRDGITHEPGARLPRARAVNVR